MSEEKEPRKKNQQRKKPNTGKKVGITILIIAIILLAAIAGGYFYITHSLNKMKRTQLDDTDLGINKQVAQELGQYKGITNVAIFGIDEPKGTPGRSDTIMIATIDTNNNTLKVTSLLRDSNVNIPGYGMNKINAAYAFGGPQLALKTINENYNMDIKYYVSEDFTTLPKLVNMVGGITVNITPEMLVSIKPPLWQLNQIYHENVPYPTKTGEQTLNGLQAMAYVRSRHGTGGDYARTYRQREVLQQIYTKIRTLPVTEYPGLLDQILPTVETNLSNSQIMTLAAEIVKMGAPSIQQARLPLNSDSHGATINGEWFLVFNQAQTNQQLHDFIYNNKPLPNEEYDN